MLPQYLTRIAFCVISICLLGLLPLNGNCQLFNNAGNSDRIKSVNLYSPKSQNAVIAEAIPDRILQPISTSPADVPEAKNPNIQFCMPLSNLRLTSSFGWRRHPVTGKEDFHKGIDLSARSELVYCILKGMVIETGFNPLLGNFIRINHGIVQSVYGHLSFIMVRPGQAVNVAQIIGVTGTSGRVTGEHLHFSIKSAGNYIHPLHFLKELTK